MYEEDLFNDLPSTLSTIPIYDMDPHLNVSREVVVQTELPSYAAGNVHDFSPRTSDDSEIKKISVIVARKVVRDSTSDFPGWVPKRIVLKTAKRTIETVAWAHAPNETTRHCKEDDEINTDHNPPAIMNETYKCDPSTSSNLHATRKTISSTTSKKQYVEIKKFTVPVNMKQRPNRTEIMQRQRQIVRSNLPEVSPQTVETLSRSKERGYPCTRQGCSAVLPTATALRKHKIVHAEKSFKCETCSKLFAEQTKLRRHMMIHTGEKPFKCSEPGCQQSFALNSNLKAHLLTHSEEKPFKCAECERSFGKQYNLDIHRKRKHEQLGDKKTKH